MNVVVWGNCQAGPLARLLSAPLARQGLRVEPVPAVYLVTPLELVRVHEILRTAAVLISQPVRDEYPVPGCGTGQLAALLPPGARLITVPVAFHVAAFPWQVHGYAATGERVDAPVTDYHDLRLLLAARRGLSVESTLSWWPQLDADVVRTVGDRSRAELRRREAELDVTVSPLLERPDAMWTMSHPTNRVLAAVANDVLRVLGIDDVVTAPAVEELGQRRAPLESDVVSALGWPADTVRPEWIVDGRPVDRRRLAAAHLELYRHRQDVVEHTLSRHEQRLHDLGLL